MKRNIQLSYIILALNMAWFWLGTWVLYYLKFTNYAGIGLIEIVTIVVGFLLEIPTGAFADLFGKKKTLQIALFFGFVGSFIMFSAQNLNHLLISVFILAAGGALLSGTSDALIYDSLKELKEESKFATILSKIEKYNLVCLAIASFIGGFLYELNPGLPYLGTAIAMFIAFLLAFFLTEPAVDTEKFSFKGYLSQSKKGFTELFQSKNEVNWILRLIVIFSFATILTEVLDPALAIDFGFTEKGLGILYAVIPLITALGAHFYPKFKDKYGKEVILGFIIVTFLVSAFISPWAGLILGGSTLIYRSMFYSVVNIMSSDTVNKLVESKYRATTLSTFTMLRKLPYVIFAYAIGVYMDVLSPSRVVMVLSVVFFVAFLLVLLFKRKSILLS